MSMQCKYMDKCVQWTFEKLSNLYFFFFFFFFFLFLSLLFIVSRSAWLFCLNQGEKKNWLLSPDQLFLFSSTKKDPKRKRLSQWPETTHSCIENGMEVKSKWLWHCSWSWHCSWNCWGEGGRQTNNSAKHSFCFCNRRTLNPTDALACLDWVSTPRRGDFGKCSVATGRLTKCRWCMIAR